MKRRWWRVRRANITDELRERFELYGAEVLAHAVGSGELSSKGAELDGLLHQKRREIVDWLLEQRDIDDRRRHVQEWVEWAILVFVIVGVAADVVLVIRGR